MNKQVFYYDLPDGIKGFTFKNKNKEIIVINKN